MNAEQLTNLAFLSAKDGRAEELEAELKKLAASSRSEPGSLIYELHRSADDANQFLVYEVWRSRADLDAHLKAPGVAAFLSSAGNLLARDIDMRSFIPLDSIRVAG